MKRMLHLAILLLFVTGCSETQDPASPAEPAGLTVATLSQLQLGDVQVRLLDEMYILDEDLGALLGPGQLSAFDGVMHDLRGRRGGSRLGMDISALMYLNFIIKANPDLSEEVKAALVQLLRESTQRRECILASDLSREERLRLLRAEHEKLIAMMNRLIGERGVANVRRLIERMRQDRTDREEHFTALRIQKHVERMTRMLGLSAEQATALKRLLMAQHDDIMKLRRQFVDDPEGFRDALLRLKARYDGMFAELLTPEQLRRWKAMQQGKNDRGGRDDDRRDVNPVKEKVLAMARLLQLDNAQIAELTRLLTWQQEQILQIRAKHRNDPRGMQKALEELQAMVDRRLAGMLTPEQLRRWKALQQNTGTGRP